MHSACTAVPVRAGVEGEPQAARVPPRPRDGAPTRQPAAAAVPLGQVRVPRVGPADLMRVRTWISKVDLRSKVSSSGCVEVDSHKPPQTTEGHDPHTVTTLSDHWLLPVYS